MCPPIPLLASGATEVRTTGKAAHVPRFTGDAATNRYDELEPIGEGCPPGNELVMTRRRSRRSARSPRRGCARGLRHAERALHQPGRLRRVAEGHRRRRSPVDQRRPDRWRAAGDRRPHGVAEPAVPAATAVVAQADQIVVAVRDDASVAVSDQFAFNADGTVVRADVGVYDPDGKGGSGPLEVDRAPAGHGRRRYSG